MESQPIRQDAQPGSADEDALRPPGSGESDAALAEGDPEYAAWLDAWSREMEEREQAFLDPFAEEVWR